MIDIIRPFAGFDYVSEENPTLDVNPIDRGKTWVNVATGEVFVCADISAGLNVWVGQRGSYIATMPTDPYFVQGEFDGSKVLDISGNGRDITVSGGYPADYKDLHAVQLNEVSNTVGMGDVDFLDVSISFWFRSAGSRGKRWMSIGAWASSGTLLFYDGGTYMNGCVAVPNDDAQISSGVPFPTTGLQHLCLVRDSVTSETRLYCNGGLVGNDTSPDSSTHITGPFTIGDNTGYAAGVMADLRVYDKVLTDSEIKGLYDLHAIKYGES